ncbi:MAG: hypothetical protein WCF33_18465 [Pseudonocardiaceae bacterium]
MDILLLSVMAVNPAPAERLAVAARAVPGLLEPFLAVARADTA